MIHINELIDAYFWAFIVLSSLHILVGFFKEERELRKIAERARAKKGKYGLTFQSLVAWTLFFYVCFEKFAQ